MDGLQPPGEIERRFLELPGIMVTAYGDDERRPRARDLGVAAFLTKRGDFDAL